MFTCGSSSRILNLGVELCNGKNIIQKSNVKSNVISINHVKGVVSPGPNDCLKKTADKFVYSDAHFHPRNYVQQGLGLDKVIHRMDEIGIKYATIMPIPTNKLSSTSDPEWRVCCGEHHCGPIYYLPPYLKQKNVLSKEDLIELKRETELYVNTAVDNTTACQYKKLSPEQQKRIDPMITGLHLGDMHSSRYLLQKLDENPGVFTGIGEITIHKEVVENQYAGKHQANLKGNSEPLKKLMHTAGIIGMPVTIHCDVDVLPHERCDEPAHFEDFKKFLQDPQVQNTTIVWAHAGGLGRFVQAPKNHLSNLDAMLNDPKFKNVYLDISWDQVAKQLTDSPEVEAEWCEFIEKHSDRILFGSDSLAPQSNEAWNSTAEAYHRLLSKLTPGTKEKVMLTNYEKVFVHAREKVRTFEKEKLSKIMPTLQRVGQRSSEMILSMSAKL